MTPPIYIQMSVDLNRFEHHRRDAEADHMIYQLITPDAGDLAATFVEIGYGHIERFSQLTEIITGRCLYRTSREV